MAQASSKSLQLNLTDLQKITRQFLIALAGVGATTLLTFLPDFQAWATTTLGQNASIAPILFGLLNTLTICGFDALRRFLTNYSAA